MAASMDPDPQLSTMESHEPSASQEDTKMSPVGPSSAEVQLAEYDDAEMSLAKSADNDEVSPAEPGDKQDPATVADGEAGQIGNGADTLKAIQTTMSRLQHDLDSPQAHGISIRDINLTDTEALNIPSFHVYLSINGESLSSPSKQQAESLKRPLRNSIEHTLSGTVASHNYSFIQVQHYATGLGVYNNAIGHTQITIKDLKDFKVHDISDENERLEILRKHNGGVETTPKSMSVISFTTSTVDHNVDVVIRDSLRGKDVAREVALPQLDRLKAMVNCGSELHFQMLVLPTNNRYIQHLRSLGSGIPQIQHIESTSDPLSCFFAANEQTQKLHTLPISQIPDFGRGNMPDVGPQPRLTRYVNESQRVVAQLVGMACEQRAEVQTISNLNEETFDIATIPCIHINGEPRCVIIVKAGSRAHLLPRNGDSCYVRLDTKERVHSSTSAGPSQLSDGEIARIAEYMKPSLYSLDDDSVAKLSEYFSEPITITELESLQKSDEEKTYEYNVRLIRFLKTKSLAPLPTRKTDGEFPAQAHDPENEPFVQDQSIEAFGDNDAHGAAATDGQPEDWNTSSAQSQERGPATDEWSHGAGVPGEADWGQSERMDVDTPDGNDVQHMDNSEDVEMADWGSGAQGEDPAADTHDGNVEEDGADEMREWCPAEPVDVGFLIQKPDWQTYLVRASRKMIAERLDFVYLTDSHDLDGEDYLAIVTEEENVQRASFRQVSSDKPIKAMAHAINSLKHPPSAPKESPISVESTRASQYLLRFEKKGDVNCFDKLSGLGMVKKEKAPGFVMKEFQNLDKSKRDAFLDLESVPDGIAFIPGVAACGKSTLLQFIISAQFFGTCPSESTVQDAEPTNGKILYCVNNNAAVDTFAKSLKGKFDRMGLGPNAPHIVRLYGVESEVNRMFDGSRKPVSVFDRDRAVAVGTDDDGNFSDLDRFLAEVETSIHDQQASTRQLKNTCRNMSLHQAAFQYHLDHVDEYEDLEGLLQKIRQRVDLTKAEMNSLSSLTKDLYRNFLKNFNGIVCATPVAAADFQFRIHFRPDIVLIDEGGRLLESELLMLIAWYSGPWVIVGDKYQLSPFVHVDHSAKPPTQSHNPYVAQISYSPLSRAVDAGATTSYLRFNHRSLGNLVDAPSTLIYRGFMDIPAKKNRYTDSVRSINRIFRQTCQSLSKRESTLVVSVQGAWVRTAGSSSYNVAHVRWALKQVAQVLQDKSIVSASGDPADVLIMPFYRAQLQVYLETFNSMVKTGDVRQKDAKRVRFATLDSSQGDEADFCVVDLVQTDQVGFTGDERRICLTLTRARQGQLILMNPGSFVGLEKGGFLSNMASRAAVIRRMHTYFEANNATVVVPACVFCERPDPDHPPENCPEKDDEGSFVLCRAKYCSFELHGRHNAKNCDRVKCRSCGEQGHRTSECKKPRPCPNCQKIGHGIDQCPAPDICRICNVTGHFTQDCEAVCRICYEANHGSDLCPIRTCTRCGFNGHDENDCDFVRLQKGDGQKKCKLCNNLGHIKRDCPENDPSEKTCRLCGEPGHMEKICPKATCDLCGKDGHTRSACNKCHNCQGDGHKAKDCPNRKVPQCSSCGGEHLRKACPGFQTTADSAPVLPNQQQRAKDKVVTDMLDGFSGLAQDDNSAQQFSDGDQAEKPSDEDHSEKPSDEDQSEKPSEL